MAQYASFPLKSTLLLQLCVVRELAYNSKARSNWSVHRMPRIGTHTVQAALSVRDVRLV